MVSLTLRPISVWQGIHNHEQDQMNIRLITDSASQLYAINSLAGLQCLDDQGQTTTLISHGFYDVNEHLSASISQVHLGVKRYDRELYGRPIWDAEVRDDALYVVPALVKEIDGSTFMASVKLVKKQDTPYIATEVYDVRNCFSASLQNPALTALA